MNKSPRFINTWENYRHESPILVSLFGVPHSFQFAASIPKNKLLLPATRITKNAMGRE